MIHATLFHFYRFWVDPLTHTAGNLHSYSIYILHGTVWAGEKKESKQNGDKLRIQY
jgi:hypothetical protein